MLRALRQSATPRERFRAAKPRSLNLAYPASVCILAVFFSSTFSFLFPLIGIPAFVILLLALVSMRYIVYYGRVQMGQSRGIFGLWTLRCFGWMLIAQPLLFGLILASRQHWNYAAGTSSKLLSVSCNAQR